MTTASILPQTRRRLGSGAGRRGGHAVQLYTGEFMADEPFEEWTLPPREERGIA